MKATFQQLLYRSAWLLAILIFSLKSFVNEDTPNTIPVFTTKIPESVSSTTALGGGEIVSNGNSEIIVSGLCWSSSTTVPTVGADTTKLSVVLGSFTSLLKNLKPSTTYHVRAYATNVVGTGY